jgi:hypothetical protein
MLPPTEVSAFAHTPAVAALRGMAVIAVNGRVVLKAPASAHPSTPENITIGKNLIGGSTASSRFTGEVIAVKSEPMDGVQQLLVDGRVPRQR